MDPNLSGKHLLWVLLRFKTDLYNFRLSIMWFHLAFYLNSHIEITWCYMSLNFWVQIFLMKVCFLGAVTAFLHPLRSIPSWVSTFWGFLCRTELLNSILNLNYFPPLLWRTHALNMLWSWSNRLWKGLTTVCWVLDRPCHMKLLVISWTSLQRL